LIALGAPAAHRSLSLRLPDQQNLTEVDRLWGEGKMLTAYYFSADLF
jgi:hypothetical protein